MKNIELGELEFDPTLYVFNPLSIVCLILRLNSSRERINWLNDYKIRLDRVVSSLKVV